MSSSEKFERDFEAFLKQDGDSELAALYRKLPRPEPDAKLDAAVLAMAHRALNPQLVATPGTAARSSAARRRALWLPALSAAATAVFAIGVAVKLGPQMWSERHSQAPAAASARDDGVVHVRTIDEPAPAPPPPASPPPPPPVANGLAGGLRQEAARAATKAAPAQAPVAAPTVTTTTVPLAVQKSVTTAPAPDLKSNTELDRKELKKVENVAPKPAAPQAFPGASRPVEMDSVERKQAIAEGAWQRLHDNEPATGAGATGTVSSGAPAAQQAPTPANAREVAAPAASAAAPVRAREKPVQAEAPAPVSDLAAQAQPTGTERGRAAEANAFRADRQDAAAQPAKPQPADRDKSGKLEYEKTEHDEAPAGFSAAVRRNSHLAPQSWLAVIQHLIRDGKRDDARQNLTLFLQKYPAYKLPADVDRFAHETR
jgi:hypothetical protein